VAGASEEKRLLQKFQAQESSESVAFSEPSVSGTCKNKNIAPFIFGGNCNTEVFETYLEQVLAPELRPNQVVILDNASFHKSQRAKDIIDSVGCKLMFLPPYSPDFNKQENVWANMKKFVRKTISKNNFNIISAVSLFFNSS
jgi:transposase